MVNFTYLINKIEGGKMDKFLGVLTGIGYILAGMNSYGEYLGIGFSILLGSLITFGRILNNIREIIFLLEEINKKLSDKG